MRGLNKNGGLACGRRKAPGNTRPDSYGPPAQERNMVQRGKRVLKQGSQYEGLKEEAHTSSNAYHK